MSGGDGGYVPTEGELASVSRAFTREDVETFASLPGDEGAHHVEPDDEGRVLVHGLLRAALPSRLGCERDFLATATRYEFHRAVGTGVEITCSLTTDSVTGRADRYEVESSAVCRNEGGDTRTTAGYEGIVWKRP